MARSHYAGGGATIAEYATRAALLTAHNAGPLSDGVYKIPSADADGGDIYAVVSGGTLVNDPITWPKGILASKLGNDATYGWTSVQGTVQADADDNPEVVGNGTSAADISVGAVMGLHPVRPLMVSAQFEFRVSDVKAVLNTTVACAWTQIAALNGLGMRAVNNLYCYSSLWTDAGPGLTEASISGLKSGADLGSTDGDLLFNLTTVNKDGNTSPYLLASGGNWGDNSGQDAVLSQPSFSSWDASGLRFCWCIKDASSTKSLVLKWIRYTLHPQDWIS